MKTKHSLAGQICRLATLALALALPNLNINASAEDPVADVTAPTITSLTFAPANVDVTAGSAQVKLTISISDDLAGVDLANPVQGSWDGMVTLNSPGGLQQIPIYASSMSLVTGDPGMLNTTWEVDFTVPQGSESGIWYVGWLTLYDRAGNRLYMDVSTGTPEFSGYTFEVVSVSDVTAPQVSGLAFLNEFSEEISSITLDTSNPGWHVARIRFQVRDDISGFGTNDYVYDWNTFRVVARYTNSPAGSQNEIWNSSAYRISGDALDSIWEADLWFAQYSPSGNWDVEIYITDNAGNPAWFNITSVGADPDNPPLLTIYSNPSDVTAPLVTSLSFSPPLLDTSLSDQTLTTTLNVSDDLSGAYYAFVYIKSPSGKQTRYISCAVAPSPGTLQGTSTLPRFTEGGTWGITAIQVLDRANNVRFLDADHPAMKATFNVLFATLNQDGLVQPGAETTVVDTNGGSARITFPIGAVAEPTSVAIDVLEQPLQVPMPSGFVGQNTYYVNFHLDPYPATFPLEPPSPGMTVVLPLVRHIAPGTVLKLFRLNTTTSLLEEAISVSGLPVTGIVDSTGLSATFTGIRSLSTYVGLLPAPVITWPAPADISYGTALTLGVQLNASANVAGAFTYSPAPGTVLNAAPGQELTAIFLPSDSINYQAVTNKVTINVLKAQLTVRADNKSMVEGGPLPAFTASYDGFVNGEGPANLTAGPQFSTTATTGSPAGDYDINVFGSASPNYEITHLKGTLKVTSAGTINLTTPVYSLVNYKRLTIYEWEYTYRLSLKNAGTAKAWKVTARLIDNATQVEALDGNVSLPDIGAGQTVSSGADTFKIKINRSIPLKAGDLQWELKYSTDSAGLNTVTKVVPF